MSASAPERDPQHNLAVAAEALYILNLLLLPFLAFAVLLLLWLVKHPGATLLARCHIEQTITASIWIAVLFITCGGGIALLGVSGVQEETLWIIGVLLFTIIHATMVLLGVIGLVNAMNGKCWRYPLVGKRLPNDCVSE